MKNILKYITVVLLFIGAKNCWAQTPVNIVKDSAYTVTGTETLIATQSITLKPNTWIKSGSTFVAQISSDAYIPVVLSNENYIYTRSFQNPIQNTSSIISNKDVIENIVYFDGLGRPMQNIAIKASPNKQDIITHLEYDTFGRQTKEYLPYSALNNGAYTAGSTALANTLGVYSSVRTGYEQTNNPYSEKLFEASPLNKVIQQAAPGNDWAMSNNHTIKMDYQANTALDGVKLYNITLSFANNTYSPTLSVSTTNGGLYAANELYKTITKDENWIAADLENKTTQEFKNKEGQIILKRTFNNGSYDTYYIYDSYGNLTYVLPPKAEGAADDNTLNNLGYQYKYDSRNRLVEKKLPGKEWEYIVYDKLDRPILIQDANLRGLNKWIFTKYDAFSRVAYTGLISSSSPRTTLQNDANGTSLQCVTKSPTPTTIAGTTIYYSNDTTVYPTSNISELHTINYYDDYNFDLNGGTSAVSYGITPITNVKGLATGSKVRVLGTSNWITNVSYFNTKDRPIYNYNINDYLATTNTVKSQLDFSGKTLETTSTHSRTGTTTLVVDAFSYDHTGRLLTQKQTINNQAQEVIAVNNYDDLGQLTSKGIGGKIAQNRLQTVNYNYNIRGWLKNINDVNAIATDLFAFKINYNDITDDPSRKLYNGNISQTFWKTANTDSNNKNYIYTYDVLNRLTDATDNLSKFNENIWYDKNGNITNLTRKGEIVGGVPSIANPSDFGTMDNLTYTYDGGNRLQIVSDSSNDTYGFKDDLVGSAADTTTDYTYDSNGNMITDTNKAITNIVYNHLNLPTQVTIAGANINYTYDATGTKQQKIVNGTTTDYAGAFIYENGNIKFFSQPEGYVVNNSGTFYYIYQYKDHLGNVRLSYQDKNNSGAVDNTEIVEENNYYPFGLKQKGYNYVINGTEQKYKYNGKELQDELGLGMYDFGARNYDPALGRWMNIDPLAETSRRWTPYTYAYNNPMYFVDPDGMEANDWVRTHSGQMLYDSRVTDQKTATALYGSGSTYKAVGTTYTSSSGTSVELGDHGFFKSNGNINMSPDVAEAAIAAKRDRSGEVMQAGAGLAAATVVVGGGNPVNDAAAGVELASAGAMAISLKAAYEIGKIMDKDMSTPGYQYALVAKGAGDYPVMTSGSSTPTDTMHLNAGDVWKYGETTSTSRYTDDYKGNIGTPGVQEVIQFRGTQMQIKIVEKSRIYNYYLKNGQLPPGNKIFR